MISMDFLTYNTCYMHGFSNEEMKVVGGKKIKIICFWKVCFRVFIFVLL